MAPTRRVVALLRGVNVGGHRKVPMAALRDALGAAGAGSVATYIQSGNVAFDTELPLEDAAALVAGAVEAASGVADVEVIVRDQAHVVEVVGSSPFPTDDPKKLHVAFLPIGGPTAAEMLGHLDSSEFASEAFEARQHELYLWLPDGGGRSPLDSTWQKLSRRCSTMRNWATVTKLAEL